MLSTPHPPQPPSSQAGKPFQSREQNLKTLTPNPSSQRERGAYFLIFKTCFLSIRKKVFKLILGKEFKNSKFYFETVSLLVKGGTSLKF